MDPAFVVTYSIRSPVCGMMELLGSMTSFTEGSLAMQSALTDGPFPPQSAVCAATPLRQ